MPIVPTMAVTLASEPGHFDIVAKSIEAQRVSPDLAIDALNAPGVIGFTSQAELFGRWEWDVTPRMTGKRRLLLRVSGMVDESGFATLPAREFPVDVGVRYRGVGYRAIKRVVPALILAGLGGIAAAYTQAAWWP